MTEKRYCNGTLAKWYYSRTNVISDGYDEYYLRSKESIKDWEYNELLGTNDLLDELNRLSNENEQLKKKLQKERTSHTKQHLKWSNEAEQQIKELSEENEQLKQLIKETLEITPMKHSLAVKLKNSIMEMYE